jgi:dTDP-4-dehydrorhamnose reductase
LAEAFRTVLAEDDVIPVSHADLDICEAEAVSALASSTRPDCIINTAAFNLVDASEDRAEEAFHTNTVGVAHLARAAQAHGSILVHFSSNYVFDGEKHDPYVETDIPRPLSIYGFSKLGGEWAAQQYCRKHLVIRTAALYGAAGNRSKGGNFVERVLQAAQAGKPLRIVNDQIVNPTHAADLAHCVSKLIRASCYGLFHVVNEGACSWFDFAREIFRHAAVVPDLQPISTAAHGAKARRPAFSALLNEGLRKAGFPAMPRWQDALAAYMRARKFSSA